CTRLPSPCTSPSSSRTNASASTSPIVAAVMGQWPAPAPEGVSLDWFLLVASLAVILAGAQLFTNGIEWVGEGFGLSHGVVGSVLAAIGTALPETILPIIAILGSHGASGDEIGIGAILGAPFMLTTLAMCLVGVSLAWFSRGGRRTRTL